MCMNLKLTIQRAGADCQEDVSAMEGTFFFRDADVDGFGIYQDSVSAIVAMYYDAKVRYGHTGDDAVHYLHTFLEQSAWSSLA